MLARTKSVGLTIVSVIYTILSPQRCCRECCGKHKGYNPIRYGRCFDIEIKLAYPEPRELAVGICRAAMKTILRWHSVSHWYDLEEPRGIDIPQSLPN